MSPSPSKSKAHSLIYIGHLPSGPIGPLWVAVSEVGLVAIDWDMTQAEFTRQLQHRFSAEVIYDETRTSPALSQLSEYLAGIRHEFDLPLDLSRLTPFQQRVLSMTKDIPYGQTSTYKALATRLGNPRASRAVGRAEATNPLPLVIPCHRLIGTDGTLHGYGGPGGIKLKEWLLNLERT